MKIHLSEIINIINPQSTLGNIDRQINKINQLDPRNDREDVLMWASEKFRDKLKHIKKSVIICSSLPKEFIQEGCSYVITESPRNAFQKVLTAFFLPSRERIISKTAIISENAKIGKDLYVGNNVVIEDDCVIGDNVTIDHNTVIKRGTFIGNNVVIGSNSTIGGVGFGYEKEENQYNFIPHIGNVEIGDNVEIGNNTCIDRAVLGSTILMDGVKVDNLVHIAHGVKIGRNSLIIANAMIAGSVEIGENTWIAPSSSIINQKKVGSDVTVGLGAIVVKNIPDGQTVIGNPAEEITAFLNKKRREKEKTNISN